MLPSEFQPGTPHLGGVCVLDDLAASRIDQDFSNLSQGYPRVS